MTKHNHSISLKLSKEAQKAAILDGQPAAECQVYSDIPASLLADLLALPWTKVTEEGWAICEVPGHTPLESGTEREKPRGAVAARQRPRRRRARRGARCSPSSRRRGCDYLGGRPGKKDPG